jgi:formate dehydrogenase major subunit
MTTISLNGQPVEAHGSLLDTILAASIELPHLCKDDHLPAIGACRTCLVEADGRVVASCSLPADSAKEVTTSSDRAVRLRAGVLALTAAMIVDGDEHRGPVGDTFEATLQLSGADGSEFEHRSGPHEDASNPFFTFRESACILCARCVTACQALQHISAIGIAGHGQSSRVTPGAGVSFRESICTSCGSCVAACPTHALAPKSGGFS